MRYNMTVKQRNFGLAVFLLILSALCVLYYDGVLDKGPQGNHIWRQADCLSITKKYQEGASFHQPQLHLLWADNYTTGKSAGEFPGIYYITGNLWKLTGESFLAYRLIWLLIMIAGLMALFRSLQLLYDSNFWAGAVTLLIFASPAYAFYGVSFLSDGPAFGFLLMSLYFLLLYQLQGKTKWMYWFAGLMALSGLLKASMLIAFVFLGIIYLLETLFGIKTLRGKKLFQDKWHGFAAMAIVLVCEIAWIVYAREYNKTHGYYYTFNEPHPIWDAAEGEFSRLWNNIKLGPLPVFHNITLICMLGISFLANLFLFKKLPLFASLANIFIVLGSASYFILWSGFIGAHDYYFIPFLMLVFSCVLPLMWLFKERFSKPFHSKLTKALLVVFVFFNVYYCKEILRFKFGRQEGESWIVMNDEFEGLMRWHNWMLKTHWNNLYFIRPELEKMGVKKEDKVITYPDQSFSISLFFLDRDGWTNMIGLHSEEQIEHLKKQGAKYLITHDTELEKAEFLDPYRKNEVGRFNNVRVYKL